MEYPKTPEYIFVVDGWIPQFFQYVTFLWENYACCEFWLPKSGVDEMMQYAPVL